VTTDGTRFHQAGGHGDVLQGLLAALGNAAQAVANVQIGVPQQGKERGQLLLVAVDIFLASQDQQVDVGVGVQFAASVTANGQQADVIVRPDVKLAGAAQHLVHEPGAPQHQLDDVLASGVAGIQYPADVL